MHKGLAGIVAAAIACASVTAAAQDTAHAAMHEAQGSGCTAFSWNVSRELALMDAPTTPLQASRGATPARAELDRHYLARLAPQAEVKLAAKPGKPMLDDGARAGLVTFRVPKTGLYRVAISSGHWIDVVDAGKVIVSRDFQGHRGCDKVHKIVEFELPADRDLTLQFSGGASEDVGFAITAAPPAQ